MLVWFLSRSHPHFHPSAFMAAPTPEGRAAPHVPWSMASRAWHGARFLTGLVLGMAAIGCLILGMMLLVALGGIHPALAFPAFFAPMALLISVSGFDWHFWLIRRAHDHGKSWLWAITPSLALAFAVLTIVLALILGGPVTGVITAALVILCVAIPAFAYLYHLIYAPGQAGPNQYGPAPEAIPAHWLSGGKA